MTWETDTPASLVSQIPTSGSDWGNDVPVSQPSPNRAGEFGSGINQGVALTADQLLNAPQRIYNLGAEWYNQQEKPASWPQLPQYADPNLAQRAFHAMGFGRAPSLDNYLGG